MFVHQGQLAGANITLYSRNEVSVMTTASAMNAGKRRNLPCDQGHIKCDRSFFEKSMGRGSWFETKYFLKKRDPLPMLFSKNGILETSNTQLFRAETYSNISTQRMS